MEFSQTAAFGKRITLAKLKKQGASPRLAKWVKSVAWSYKLAPNTVNLSATASVKEIEVLDVVLRAECSTARARAQVVEQFSTLIPNPCIIRLYGEGDEEVGIATCPKLSGGALYGDSPVYRVAVSRGPSEAAQDPWAGVTTLEALLIRVTAALAGMAVVPGEALKDFIARHYRLEALGAELGELEKKIAKERQMDIKYQLAKDKQKLQKEIEKCSNT